MTTMTPEELAEIEARADAATEGPWEVDAMDAGHSRYEMNVWVAAGAGDTICDMNGLGRSRNESVAQDDGYKDAQFIAHARTDVPALLTYARDLEARVRRVEAVHKPKSWTKYGIPCFDEFDSPTARINGCTCGSEYYPCPTIAALTTTEGQV